MSKECTCVSVSRCRLAMESTNDKIEFAVNQLFLAVRRIRDVLFKAIMREGPVVLQAIVREHRKLMQRYFKATRMEIKLALRRPCDPVRVKIIVNGLNYYREELMRLSNVYFQIRSQEIYEEQSAIYSKPIYLTPQLFQ